MVVKVTCPNCGVHTDVYLDKREEKAYCATGRLPDDFDQRVVCDLCREDGFSMCMESSMYGADIRVLRGVW